MNIFIFWSFINLCINAAVKRLASAKEMQLCLAAGSSDGPRRSECCGWEKLEPPLWLHHALAEFTAHPKSQGQQPRPHRTLCPSATILSPPLSVLGAMDDPWPFAKLCLTGLGGTGWGWQDEQMVTWGCRRDSVWQEWICSSHAWGNNLSAVNSASHRDRIFLPFLLPLDLLYLD